MHRNNEPNMKLNTAFKAIKYLLWDNDGVLVDTEQFYFASGQQVLEENGIPLTMAQFREISLEQGQSVFDMAADYGISDARRHAMRQERDRLYSAYLQSENILIPGAREVVATCAAHFRMCIVSSSMKNNFYEIHARTGNLLSYFEFHLLNGDYPRSKPHPDPWLTAMSRFNASPKQCLVIEDSPRGIQAATAAGMAVVAVASRFFNEQALLPHLTLSDHCISSIRDLPELLGQTFS